MTWRGLHQVVLRGLRLHHLVLACHPQTYSDLHEENTETGVFFPRASKRPSNQLEVFQALRDLEQRAQIKRISPAENTSREIQESGINPDKTSLNSISSFGSRSEQISASRKPLFLDTTLCLKVRGNFCEIGLKLISLNR